MITATITSIIQATPKIKIFTLSYRQENYSFKAGQWIDLKAPIDEGKNIGGYTIISSPETEKTIDLAVRESNHHPVTQFLHRAKVGAEVEITEGQGQFFLTNEVANSKSMTFIAGGIGVTPILSMIRSLISKKASRFKLFYSVSYEEDLLFKDELAPFSVFTVTKEECKMAEKERLSLALLLRHNVDLDGHFFICGPRPLIDSITSELKEAGVDSARLHFEKWW